MKQFKLNPFEKFVIRHKKAVNILSFAVFFLAYIIISICKDFINIPLDTFIPFFLYIASFIYIELMPAIKNDKVVQAHQNLDISYAIDGINKLSEVVNPKDTVLAPLYRNNKAAFLIEAGQFEEAEAEIKRFFQIFDTRKLLPTTLLTIHINYAILKIHEKDEEGYKEQLKIVESYYDKVKKSKLKTNIRIADNALTHVLKGDAAHFGPYSDGFEQKVLNDIKFFGDKKKKKITPYDYFSAYSALFDYFVRFENTEKALYYADKMIKIGNSGFLDYRNAKEYLENADKCN